MHCKRESRFKRCVSWEPAHARPDPVWYFPAWQRVHIPAEIASAHRSYSVVYPSEKAFFPLT